MFRQHKLIAIAAVSIGLIFVMNINFSHIETVAYGQSDKRECGSMSWKDKDHGDNDPSSSKFKQAAYKDSLCELAKKIDHSIVSNHDSVNWNKFKQSHAFITATSDQKECLTKAAKKGNGMNGLGGYEIMDCGIGEGYKE